MTGHPSSKLFTEYFRRLLAPAELLALDDHVTNCGRCRERLRGMTPTHAALASLRACMESAPATEEQPEGAD